MAAVAVPLDAAGAAVALAFKVVYDRRSKKPFVWLRTYAGELAPGVTMFNGRNGLEERPTRLVQMHGEETVDLQSVGPGAICAAVGLRHTRTGDTLVVRPAAEWAEIALQPVLRVPTPVFFTAVEVGSAVQQPALDAALEALCLEVRSPLIALDALVAADCALHHDLLTISARSPHDLLTGPFTRGAARPYYWAAAARRDGRAASRGGR
jgi:elongation factor G